MIELSPRTAQEPSAERDTHCLADVLAALIDAIGEKDFSARFLDAMRALAGVDLCSVFLHDSGGDVKLLLADGGIADFSLRASLDYARSYWRSDIQLAQLVRVGGNKLRILRRPAVEIADPAYRAACYDRAGVTERLSIVWPGRPRLVVNGYRTGADICATVGDAERLERHAGLLVAALKQHLRAQAANPHRRDETCSVGHLIALGYGLSTREAEVSAALIRGETQQEIADSRQLSLATVITYRRRAYDKLGVGNQRELTNLFDRSLAPIRTEHKPLAGQLQP